MLACLDHDHIKHGRLYTYNAATEDGHRVAREAGSGRGPPT